MSEQQHNHELEQQQQQHIAHLDQLADELERQLRDRHPMLASYLDLTIHAVWIGGNAYDVLGELHLGRENAAQSVRAAIMHKLIAAENMNRQIERSAAAAEEL